MNPFKIADELIKRRYRIPVFSDSVRFTYEDDWEPETLREGHIDLSELLEAIRTNLWFLQDTLKHTQDKLRDFESIILVYSKRPTRTWQSGSPGEYDPQSGFHGAIYGETDDYKEARELAKKWRLK